MSSRTTRKDKLCTACILAALFLVPTLSHAQDVQATVPEDASVIKNVISSVAGVLGIQKPVNAPNIAIVFKQPTTPTVAPETGAEEDTPILNRNIPKPVLEGAGVAQDVVATNTDAIILGTAPQRSTKKTHFTVFPKIPMLPGFEAIGTKRAEKDTAITLTKEPENSTILQWNP